jgi:hypothetical protein
MTEVGWPPLDTRLGDTAAGLRGQGPVSLRGALVDVMGHEMRGARRDHRL